MLNQHLSALLANIVAYDGADPMISGLCIDSRMAKPHELFLASRGTQQDGRMFIENAIQNGVAGVIYEAENLTPQIQDIIEKYKSQLPMIAIQHLDEKVGLIAQRFYQNPAQHMHLVGVTGTNGKTSCAYFLTEALELLGKKAAMMGTIGIGATSALKESSHTTLTALPLQQQLYELNQQQFKYINMEVSSHALDQHRVAHLPFEVALFTNLTLDHLDYHKTMQAYGEAKAKLFKWPSLKYAVVNLDDAFSNTIIDHISDKVKIIGVTLNGKTHARCDLLIQAQNIQLSADETTALVIASARNLGEFKTPILGHFNLSNLLLVLGALLALEVPFNDALQVLQKIHEPPGRLTKIGGHHQAHVFIDYAHTPDALEKVLTVLKPLCQGQLWCVFGCGGDRDKSKRPIMARIAEQYANKVIVTDDNPRTENSEQIIADILQGLTQPKQAIIEHDRTKAIQYAIKHAAANDFVLIAGKGHED
ncbi:MAG: UDP-N-acetylmuramoyl-L-alanyl-D-glutamate--2,6-diaminopimelate ligase, partial [Gammaproteobacteria bacterium]